MTDYIRKPAREVKAGDRVFCVEAKEALPVTDVYYPPIPGVIRLRFSALLIQLHKAKELVLVAK